MDWAMFSWVVTCVFNGSRLYLTPRDTATYAFKRAMQWRFQDNAEYVAAHARQDQVWRGFNWQAASVAAEMAQSC